jgi:hypothetical protein
MTQSNKLHKLARSLVIAEGLIWIGFALFTVLGPVPGLPEHKAIRWGIAALALAAGSGLLLLLQLSARLKLAYFALLAALEIIAILSITDQVELPDLAALALNLLALVMLLLDRKSYLNRDAVQD